MTVEHFPEALHGVLQPVQLLVRLSQGDQHAGVVGPQLLRLLVVVEAVERHLEHLVRLAKSVPGAVVSLADL